MDDVQALIDKYGYWGEHPEHALETWRYEVANNDTRMGYWDWVEAQESEGE
jgi:hypothetical protein